MIPHSLLLSGMDIPFPEARVNIVQPKVKDILYISEDSFYSGCELLNFSKDVLYQQDKVGLEDKTNFDVLMSIMTDKSNNNGRAFEFACLKERFEEKTIELKCQKN